MIPAHGIRKSEFARLIGVSSGRVTQLIARGLPVEIDETINELVGLDWCRRNLNRPLRLSHDFGAMEESEIDELARLCVEHGLPASVSPLQRR